MCFNSKRSKISLLLPTRRRVPRLEAFLESVFQTATFANRVEIILGVDNDDSESLAFEYDKLNVIKTVAPRCGMGELNSRCLSKSNGDVMILVNDDIIVKTQGWDIRVDELHQIHEDKIYLGYFNDGLKGKKMCTFPIISKICGDLLQTPFPNDYKGSLIDLDLLEVFNRLEGMGQSRIHYIEDVLFQHEHFQLKPSFWDTTYEERERFGDDQTFYNNLKVRIEKSRVLLLTCEGNKKTHNNIPDSSKITFFEFAIILLLDRHIRIVFKLKHIIHMFVRNIFRKAIHPFVS